MNKCNGSTLAADCDQRLEMLKALSCVDIVRPYHELEYVSGCRGLDADIFVIGADWGAKPHNIVVETYLRANGKKSFKFPTTQGLPQPG